jgi:hypothetical protein
MAPLPPAAQSRYNLLAGQLFPIPIFAVILWFALAENGAGDLPSSWALLLPLLFAVGAASYCELAGFRARPLPPGGEAAAIENESWLLFNKSVIQRYVACDAAFLASIPIGFVVDSVWPILLGAALSLPMVAWQCWPGRRNRKRFAAGLEAGGHPSYLLGCPLDSLERPQDPR